MGFFKKLFANKKASKPSLEEVLPVSTDLCKIEDLHGQEVDYACGHRMQEKFTLNFFGLTSVYGDEALSQRNWCANCLLVGLSKSMIRCCKCGFGIMSSQGCTVYPHYTSASIKTPWSTVFPNEHGFEVVGCVRMFCFEGDGTMGTLVIDEHLDKAHVTVETADGRTVGVVFPR